MRPDGGESDIAGRRREYLSEGPKVDRDLPARVHIVPEHAQARVLQGVVTFRRQVTSGPAFPPVTCQSNVMGSRDQAAFAHYEAGAFEEQSTSVLGEDREQPFPERPPRRVDEPLRLTAGSVLVKVVNVHLPTLLRPAGFTSWIIRRDAVGMSMVPDAASLGIERRTRGCLRVRRRGAPAPQFPRLVKELELAFNTALRGCPLEYPMKVGRNDPCPCGSGVKYKRCCALKGDVLIDSPRKSPSLRWVLIAVLVVGGAVALSFGGQDSGSNLVWSAEHGHWHDPATGMEPSTAPGAPMGMPQGALPPPGVAPPGKVWSVEHGHWHDK